jgi:hypothetical protein
MQLEEQMEALLERIGPGLSQCKGASPQDIARIEALAGQPLPPFYRWFLERMGGHPGGLPNFFLDYTADAVLEAYDDGDAGASPPILLIARMEDPLMRMDLYYDLSQPARDDALVVRGAAGDGTYGAETLREWIAYLAMVALRIRPSPQRCRGTVKDLGGEVGAEFARVMGDLGFTQPIATGPYCSLFERDDVTLVAKVDPEPENRDFQVFYAGADDSRTLRALLGQVAVQGGLEVSISAWEPTLPRPST